jgi:hypothetical protein
LTQNGNIVDFWLNQFLVKDLKNDNSIVAKGFLDSKDGKYKCCDLPQPDLGLTTLIAQTDEQRKIWHEHLGHLNFQSLKSMVIWISRAEIWMSLMSREEELRHVNIA